ncbi:M48 family metalloprotease [Pelomonas aquatica]|nr:M48 family metalloprotease [Pelomonas aquatica]MCY4753577.1 M48 family metalloprotease [Pelomonas aquatica]
MRRWRPGISVVETTSSSGFQANTSWRTIFIDRAALRSSSEARRYLLAHELGHLEGWHSVITVCAGLFIVLGIAGAIRSAAAGNLLSAALFALASFAALAVLWMYAKTMVFEWEADRRGARMLGRDEMLRGMDQVAASRLSSQQSYYECKRRKLNGCEKGRFGVQERRDGNAPGGLAGGT